MTASRRIRLTNREIETILVVAGDALAAETLSNHEDEGEADKDIEAFESGMDKLRAMLARRESR